MCNFYFFKETKLAATSTEIAEWVDPRNESRQANYRQTQQGKECLKVIEDSVPTQGKREHFHYFTFTESKIFNFVTECFFLTMRSFHLGFAPALSGYSALGSRLGVLSLFAF